MAGESHVDGINELIAKLTRLGTEGTRTANAIVSVVADMIVVDAKRNAPADLGVIRQNIGKTTVVDGNKVTATIFSSAPESPFQEFGTGGKVVVPQEMADIAATFKGKSGGDFKAFVLALTGWLQRHGIPEKAAYPVARKILLQGLRPQPFLYPAYVANKGKLLPMLQAALQQQVRNGQST